MFSDKSRIKIMKGLPIHQNKFKLWEKEKGQEYIILHKVYTFLN